MAIVVSSSAQNRSAFRWGSLGWPSALAVAGAAAGPASVLLAAMICGINSFTLSLPFAVMGAALGAGLVYAAGETEWQPAAGLGAAGFGGAAWVLNIFGVSLPPFVAFLLVGLAGGATLAFLRPMESPARRVGFAAAVGLSFAIGMLVVAYKPVSGG